MRSRVMLGLLPQDEGSRSNNFPQKEELISTNVKRTAGAHDLWVPAAGCICCCMGALLIAPLLSLYHHCTILVWTLMQFHGDTYILKIGKPAIYRPLWDFMDFQRDMESGYQLSMPNFMDAHNSLNILW